MKMSKVKKDTEDMVSLFCVPVSAIYVAFIFFSSKNTHIFHKLCAKI